MNMNHIETLLKGQGYPDGICAAAREGFENYEELPFSVERYISTFSDNKSIDYGWVTPNFTCLQGKRAYFDETNIPGFFLSLIRDYSNGIYHSFQEPISAGDIIKLFLDLDSEKPIESSILNEIIHEVKQEYFHLHDVPRTFDLTHTIVQNKAKPQHKYHIYFNVFVTKEVAKFLAEKVKLSLTYKSYCIDTTYSGLRLPYQIKRYDYTSVYNPNTDFSVLNMFLTLMNYRVRAWSHQQVSFP